MKSRIFKDSFELGGQGKELGVLRIVAKWARYRLPRTLSGGGFCLSESVQSGDL
jgi:hypothetical protein